MIDQETHHTIYTEIIPTIGTEVIQIIEIKNIIIDHEITQTIDQITKYEITTIIKISRDNYQETIHKIGLSRLASAQGSTLTNYGKIQFFLVPTKNNGTK